MFNTQSCKTQLHILKDVYLFCARWCIKYIYIKIIRKTLQELEVFRSEYQKQANCRNNTSMGNGNEWFIFGRVLFNRIQYQIMHSA